MKMNYKKLKKLPLEELDKMNSLSKKEIEKSFNNEDSKTTKKFKEMSGEYADFLDDDKTNKYTNFRKNEYKTKA